MVLRAATFLLACIVAILAWPAVQRLREKPPAPPPATRLSFSQPSTAVELGAGEELLDAAISPDEREVAFVATSDGVSRLWRRKLEDEKAVAIPGTEGAQQPAWKSTGSVISFFAAGKLKQISLDDGAVRDLADAPIPAGATWQSDGSVLFASGAQGTLNRLSNGRLESATTLRSGDLGHTFPTAIGAGRFLYVAVRADGRRTVRLVADGQERDLTTTSGHAQLVGGLFIHVRDDTLLAQQFDAEKSALVGRGSALALDVGVSPSGRALMVASPKLLLFAASVSRPRELAWFDAEGQRTGTSGEPGDYWQVRLSPDDRSIAATMSDPLLRALDVFVVPAEGSGGPVRLTLALAADTDPVWSPDGGRVLFRSFQDGQPNLFTRRVGVPGAPDEPMLRTDGDEIPSDWIAAPKLPGRVLFTASARDGNSDVSMFDVGAGSQTPVAKNGFNESDARWSPDRRWLSYVSEESGRPDVYAARWPDGGRVRVSFAGGSRPRWSSDGRALFFLRGDAIMRASRPDASSEKFEPARQVTSAPGIRDFDVAHRSNRLLVLKPIESGARADVRVIVDWQSLVVSN